MRNPLNKRIPKELKQDFGKYLVIFLFLIMLIGLISGFLVADNSVTVAYNESFEKYNVEDGHMSFDQSLDKDMIKEIEDKADITMYELPYFEETIKGTKKTIRVYGERKELNKVCLMSGALPAKDNEIALDRLFAQNNKIAVGDSIELGKKTVVVSGLVALTDYSCLFEKNTDSMFDSINFCVAVMTNEGYDAFASTHETANYAWKYADSPLRTDKKKGKELSDDLVDVLKDVVKNYDEAQVQEAVDMGKQLVFANAIKEMKKSGMDMAMFENEQAKQMLYDQIMDRLHQEGFDLNKELELEEDSELKLDTELRFEDFTKAFDMSEQEMNDAENFVEDVEDRVIEIKDYVPLYQNQAINFTGDDMGSDKAMFLMFDYIITIVLAFVFAVIISNTITQEAGVIGTLRASGYTRGEMVRHYMVLPILVSLVAAVVGNILGYTVLKNYMVDMYYNNYSLVTYKTLWNLDAFLLTTVAPLLIMFMVNLFVLTKKLRLSPLRFIRRDLSKRGKKKSFRLHTKIPFMIRFRLRILFQNIPNYVTLVLGIILGGAIIIFGTMLPKLLVDYKDMVIDERICEYQYVLMEEKETDTKDAEKFAMSTLKTTLEGYLVDEMSIYGIVEDSKYVDCDIPAGKVVISSAVAEKFQLKKGDEITLNDEFNDEEYTFEIAGVYQYSGALAMFMPLDEYNKTFKEKDDHFTGYFSNEEIKDIDSDDIATVISIDDLTKITDQLMSSMGSFMGAFKYFGMIMFLLLMYLLSKQIIEKNAQSISMVKILGFKNGEIGGLYIVATSLVVLLGLLVAIPLVDGLLRWAFAYYLYTIISGYIPYIVSADCYIQMVLLGVLCYAFVAVLQMFKINRIPKTDALKNVE